MTHIRKNLREPGTEWSEHLLWYARAVGEMQTRAFTDTTSWKFFAAIHGFHEQLWRAWDCLGDTETLPDATTRGIYWDQCQHNSWYFLPWHRGYIKAIEDVLYAIVQANGGPQDWGLPYWDYFIEGQDVVPAEFSSQDWPDKNVEGAPDVNPLYVARRYGSGVDRMRTNLTSLTLDTFTEVGTAGGGFGGPSTGFNHEGGLSGRLEAMPHNIVHGTIGGREPGSTDDQPDGLMAFSLTAGLDPIFWMHHVNVDRLWEVWRLRADDRTPTDVNWLQGPSDPQRFVMPAVDGQEAWFTPASVLSLRETQVQYDNVPDVPTPTAVRLPEFADSSSFTQRRLRSILPMTNARNDPEVVGSNDEAVSVIDEASTRVRLVPEAWTEPQEEDLEFRHLNVTGPPRVRLFLNLENVRGVSDSALCDVYVGVPEGEDPAAHPELRVGSMAPFGLRGASSVDGRSAGQGLTFVFEITDEAAPLLAENPQADLAVRIVPTFPLREVDELTIGSIKIYRQLS